MTLINIDKCCAFECELHTILTSIFLVSFKNNQKTNNGDDDNNNNNDNNNYKITNFLKNGKFYIFIYLFKSSKNENFYILIIKIIYQIKIIIIHSSSSSTLLLITNTTSNIKFNKKSM
jgi:hypothetical protein